MEKAEDTTFRKLLNNGVILEVDLSNNGFQQTQVDSLLELGVYGIVELLSEAFNNQGFINSISQYVELESLPPIKIMQLQSGNLAYILEAKIGGISVILDISRGQFPNNHIHKLLERQIPYDETNQNIYRYLSWFRNEQLLQDFRNLRHLKDVFEERGIPIAIPEPIGVYSTSIDRKPATLLALSKVTSSVGYISEINPNLRLSRDFFENPEFHGLVWYWWTHTTTNPHWNSHSEINTDFQYEAREHMEQQMAYILACVYFATGKTPTWFDPSAGDVMLIDNNPGLTYKQSLKHLLFALITTRGGLYPLNEDLIKLRGQQKAAEIIPPNMEKSIFLDNEIVEQPNMGNLLLYFSQCRIRPAIAYNDRLRGMTAPYYFPMFQTPAYIYGVKAAYHDFYKTERDILELIQFPYLSEFSQKQITLNGLKLKNSELSEDLMYIDLRFLLAFDKFFASLLTKVQNSHLRAEPLLDGHISNDNTINQENLFSGFPIYLVKSIADMLLGFSNSEEKGDYTVERYHIPPKLIGDKEKVYFEIYTSQVGKRNLYYLREEPTSA